MESKWRLISISRTSKCIPLFKSIHPPAHMTEQLPHELTPKWQLLKVSSRWEINNSYYGRDGEVMYSPYCSAGTEHFEKIPKLEVSRWNNFRLVTSAGGNFLPYTVEEVTLHGTCVVGIANVPQKIQRSAVLLRLPLYHCSLSDHHSHPLSLSTTPHIISFILLISK